MPSGTSFGVACKRSNRRDLVPALGGATSPGIVSMAPGGGTCCSETLLVLELASKSWISWMIFAYADSGEELLALTPGALGLTTTLGGSWWAGREGVPPAGVPWLPAAPSPDAAVDCCCDINCEPALSEFDRFDWAGCEALRCGPLVAASLDGRGLFRWSVNVVVDEVGVALAELAGECVADPP